MKTIRYYISLYRLGVVAWVFFTNIAAAQYTAEIPKTVPIIDDNGKTVGTATRSENRIYLRNTDGELTATIVLENDGTKTMYDPNGKVLDEEQSKKRLQFKQ